MSTEREQDLAAARDASPHFGVLKPTDAFRLGHDAGMARAREERYRLRCLLAQCMASNLGDRLRGEIEVALGLRGP